MVSVVEEFGAVLKYCQESNSPHSNANMAPHFMVGGYKYACPAGTRQLNGEVSAHRMVMYDPSATHCVFCGKKLKGLS